MVAPDGYYEQSYPPSLWAPAAPPVTAGRAPAPAPAGADEAAGSGDAALLPPGLTAAAGAPGAYDPPVRAADRPANMAELREGVRPATREPWPAGTYVLVGENGRRAHWSGSEWLAGESPGYADRSAP